MVYMSSACNAYSTNRMQTNVSFGRNCLFCSRLTSAIPQQRRLSNTTRKPIASLYRIIFLIIMLPKNAKMISRFQMIQMPNCVPISGVLQEATPHVIVFTPETNVLTRPRQSTTEQLEGWTPALPGIYRTHTHRYRQTHRQTNSYTHTHLYTNTIC